MRFLFTITCVALLAAACSDDDGSTGAGGSTTTTTTAGPTTATSGGPTTTSMSGPTSSSSSGGTGGSYEGVDPIEGIADVELVQGGFEFTEGTVWLPALGVLRFSDIPASTIHELDPASDMISDWRNPSGNTNGNALAPNGDIVMCEHSGRRVSRSPAAGAPAPVLVAGEYQGMTLNSPNDAIVRSDGQVYFTDPTYGLGGGQQDIPWQGVYRVTTQGEVILVGDEYAQPNGIALSPDETKLYVSDSQDGGLFVYDVAADGSTGARTQLIDIGGSDGMAVDDAGNLYLTTGAGVEVFRDDGTPWGVIDVPEQPANCTFGGADRKTLFITARTGLYRVDLNVPGLP
jgi:gluconolactonase